MKKIYNLFIFVLLLIPLISANGIQVTDNSVISMNKTIGINVPVTFNLSNQEPFSFFNISFKSNSYITMSPISLLQSGKTVQINATVITDSVINEEIEIIGYYETNLGTSNQTFLVNVDYYTGFDVCNLILIKGDSINWINHVSDEIKLRIAGTTENLAVIAEDTNYTKKFNYPEQFDYYGTRRAIQFTSNCKITVLDDEGLISNPDLNTKLHLIVGADYEQTNLSVHISNRNYNMDFYAYQDGVITITNVGNKIAKNVTLIGSWFSFLTNSFDLSPGYAKNVPYTIHPEITITEETNKTYNKTVIILGNFNNMIENFSIYINYANIDSSTTSSQGLIEFITQFCNENPNVCNTEPQVVYKYINESNSEFNVTFTQEMVNGIFEYLFELGDNQKLMDNIQKARDANIEVIFNSTNNSVANLETKVDTIISEKESSSGVLVFGMLFTLFAAISGLLVILIFYHKKENKLKDIKRW